MDETRTLGDVDPKTRKKTGGPGSIIADTYRVEEHIASGGMGVILRARHLKMERDVAVKLLHSHVADRPDFIDRFRREASVATRFNHPNIIRVYDFGTTEGGTPFLVMELLDGEELQGLLDREGPLPLHRVVGIATDFLDGLAEAHSMEVVHRDLKPSNIFLARTHRGQEIVKLLDFGIAKAVDEDGMALTQSGIVAGTASFVAPERLIGATERYAMDVYSAALIILEMFMGRRVFDADTVAQCLLMQLKSPVPIPQRLARTPLGDVLKRASVKHPDDRYPDAGAFLDAFIEAAAASPDDLLLGPSDLPTQADQTSISMLKRVARGQGDMEMLERDGASDSSEQLPTSEMRTTDLLDTIVQDVDTDDLDTTQAAPAPRMQPQEPAASTEPATVGESDHTRSFGRWPLVGLVGGVLLAVAALGFVFLDDGDDSGAPLLPADATTGQRAQAQPGDWEPAAPPPVPERHTIEIRSAPTGAAVYEEDRLLGHTDFLFDFTQDHAPATLRFELDEHETTHIEWPDDPGDELFVELDAVEAADEPESTSEPAEPPEPASNRPDRRKTRHEQTRRRTRPGTTSSDEQKDDDSVDAVLDKYLPQP